MYGWSANNRSFLIRILMDYGSFRIIWTHCIASHGWRSTTCIPKGIPYAELELCWFFLIVLPLDGICINILMKRHFSRCCSYDKPEFSTDFSICLCYLKSCKVFLFALDSDIMFPFLWTFLTFDHSFVLKNVSIWHLKFF